MILCYMSNARPCWWNSKELPSLKTHFVEDFAMYTIQLLFLFLCIPSVFYSKYTGLNIKKGG